MTETSSASPGADRETIFALSSGAGICGVAVIRVSGPKASLVFERMVRGPRPAPRLARLAMIRAPETGEPLDQGLLLWFPGPESETGEDMAELQVHGSRAVVAAVLAGLAALPGFRLAAPGEFARRAFDAGKLDLAAVEGLADLIQAETEAQRRQALRQLSGALGARCEALRAALLGALARLEAEIDFAEDEPDVPQGLLPAVQAGLGEAAAELDGLLAEAGRGERLRDGLRIAIVGAPNVGKSSLLNALARRDVAIVSATAGTTRDVIEVHLDLAGLPVTLADTAGLRALDSAGDEVEAEGMHRTLLRAEDADLKLVLFDSAGWPAAEPEVAALVDRDSLVVINKADLAPSGLKTALQDPLTALPEPLAAAGTRPLLVSARTGAGLEGLLEALESAVTGRLGGGEVALVTRARHREALTACREALGRARAGAVAELVAEDLRLAVRALGRITGRVGVEDLLDLIFRDFCIGK